MKQVININFQGRVVPIEVSAFELLKSYTDSLARYFADEEGKDEIINDIESRIGELFQERLKKGATCITDEDVNAIIKNMGRPEEFAGDEEKVASGLGSESNTKSSSQSSYTTTGTTTHKRLYRDENNKVLGGVCGGLANYFGTDPVIIRVIFAVVALAFGTGLLAYVILWIAVPSTASTEIGGYRKKLFRDPDEKLIAGVCSGIGNYFGVNAWIPRVLFLLPFLSFVFHDLDFVRFSFSPGSLIIYIILWLAIPEASTTSEKLEMKGEKVDMNSIKNSVVEEMKGVQQRVGKFAQEAGTVAGEKAAAMGSEIKAATKRSGTSLGDVILFIVKAFAYFIIGCVAFGLVVGLFFLSIGAIGIFLPLKDFVLTDGWQNIFAWGTLIFFVSVPVIGIITWIIRRLAKMRSNRTVLRFTFLSLWIIGWGFAICLTASLTKDFRSVNNFGESEIHLTNPNINKLIVNSNSPIKNYYRYNIFRLEPFQIFDEDTLMVRNIYVKIVKSPNDSFKVTVIKMVHGQYRKDADTLANRINFNAQQNDSILIVDNGIPITRENKFRNQRVILTVYVPVGKQIRVDRNIGWAEHIHFNGFWNEGNMDIHRDDEEESWESNVDYVMKADGLYTLDGRKASDTDHDSEPNRINGGEDENGVKMKREDEKYHYYQDPVRKVDSIKANLDSTRQSVKDSLKKEIEKMNQQLQKIDGKTKTATEAMVIYPSALFMQINSF